MHVLTTATAITPITAAMITPLDDYSSFLTLLWQLEQTNTDGSDFCSAWSLGDSTSPHLSPLWFSSPFNTFKQYLLH